MSKLISAVSKKEALKSSGIVLSKMISDGFFWMLVVIVFNVALFAVGSVLERPWQWLASVYILIFLAVNIIKSEGWQGVLYYLGLVFSVAMLAVSTVLSVNKPWMTLRWVLMVLGTLLMFAIQAAEILLASHSVEGEDMEGIVADERGQLVRATNLPVMKVFVDVSWWQVVSRPLILMVIVSLLFDIQWEALFAPILGAEPLNLGTILRFALEVVEKYFGYSVQPVPGGGG